MNGVPTEVLTALSPGQLAVLLVGLMIGMPIINRVIAAIERRFSKSEARETQLVMRLLAIIENKFDKLTDSINSLARELRETHGSDVVRKK